MKKLLFILSLLIILTACGEKSEYEEALDKHRNSKDIEFATSPDSPFNYKGPVTFYPLKYFPADTTFIFKSKLTKYNTQDTVTVFGTKGEERKLVRYGYLMIDYMNDKHKVNVYQGSYSGGIYYSIWFTDETTGEETYGVGRYLNFELVDDPEHIYTLDFNYAYNPYCAYNKNYSCAIPTKEDNLDFAITAGEKKFHD